MRKALIVIDVQKDYFPGGRYELEGAEKALSAARKLAEKFREEKWPVIFVQHIAGPSAPFFRPGTEGVEIHPDLGPLASEPVVIKHVPNSFCQTTLREELEKAGAEELVICGMMTHMCIDTTVRAARDYGYAVTLAADACATRALVWRGETLPAELVQKVYLAALDGSFAKVVESEELV